MTAPNLDAFSLNPLLGQASEYEDDDAIAARIKVIQANNILLPIPPDDIVAGLNAGRSEYERTTGRAFIERIGALPDR